MQKYMVLQNLIIHYFIYNLYVEWFDNILIKYKLIILLRISSYKITKYKSNKK